MYAIVCLFITFIIAQAENDQKASYSNEVSLYKLTVEALDTYEKIALENFNGKTSIWFLFQPDCKSCQKQLSDLQCLPKDLTNIAIGFWGTREHLQKVFRGTNFRGLKAMASKEIEETLQLKATPTILFVNKNGQITHKKTHRLKCSELLKIIKDPA